MKTQNLKWRFVNTTIGPKFFFFFLGMEALFIYLKEPIVAFTNATIGPSRHRTYSGVNLQNATIGPQILFIFR